MKETRICPNCKSKMLQTNRYEKGGNVYIYVKCQKCGTRRKLQIFEKILENYRPILQDNAKPTTPDPLPES